MIHLVRASALLCLVIATTSCGSFETHAVPTSSVSNIAVSSHPQVSVDTVDVALGRRFVPGKPHFMPMRLLEASTASAGIGYPLDMARGSGPTMTSSTAFNVYVNCSDEACWGHPEEFLRGLAGSALAGVISQYTGAGSSAYQYGGSLSVKFTHPYSNTYYNNDLYSILAAAVHHFGKAGLHAEYHIFLNKGIDTCFDQTAMCYSPDNLSTFAFCAYHSAVLLNGKPIVYSVEPYQNVVFTMKGRQFYACHVPPLSKATNTLDSATASTLSHESFESWSDPEPNTGWYNSLYGEEIGDVCAYYFMTTETFNGKGYYVQEEYSNTYHGCARSR